MISPLQSQSDRTSLLVVILDTVAVTFQMTVKIFRLSSNALKVSFLTTIGDLWPITLLNDYIIDPTSAD